VNLIQREAARAGCRAFWSSPYSSTPIIYVNSDLVKFSEIDCLEARRYIHREVFRNFAQRVLYRIPHEFTDYVRLGLSLLGVRMDPVNTYYTHPTFFSRFICRRTTDGSPEKLLYRVPWMYYRGIEFSEVYYDELPLAVFDLFMLLTEMSEYMSWKEAVDKIKSSNYPSSGSQYVIDCRILEYMGDPYQEDIWIEYLKGFVEGVIDDFFIHEYEVLGKPREIPPFIVKTDRMLVLDRIRASGRVVEI